MLSMDKPEVMSEEEPSACSSYIIKTLVLDNRLRLFEQ